MVVELQKGEEMKFVTNSAVHASNLATMTALKKQKW